MKLRDYQQRASDAILHEFETAASTLLVNPTGCGKTIIFSDVIHRMQPARALVLAHRKELIWQAHDRIEEWTKLECDVEMGDLKANEEHLFSKAQVVVGTVQTQISGPADGRRRMSKFNPNEFGLLVLDECFPAGTTVGGRPIEKILPGERVLSGDGNYHRVMFTWKRQCTSLSRIKFFSGQEVICTPSHPFLVCRGGKKTVWALAFSLDRGDMVFRLTINDNINMRRVRSYLSSGRSKAENLLQTLYQCQYQQANGSNESKVCVCQDEKKQSNRSQRSKGQNICNTPSAGSSPNISRRKRNTANSATTNNGRGVGVDDRTGNPNEDAAWERVSNLLQGGCWEFVSESCGGDRRRVALPSDKEGNGCQENIFLGVDWVESVEVLKPASDGKYGGLCPDGCVYNLEIEGSPTYFADGVLVHNCHHGTSDSYRDVINYYRQNPALKVLGVTATPDRADEEALGQILETVAFDYELLDAINDGWLVDIVQRCATVKSLDYSEVRTTAGDLNGGDLSTVMEAEENIQGVVQPTLEAMFRLPDKHLSGIQSTNWPAYLATLEPPRRTIAFTVSKKQAEMMSEVFERSIPGKTAWICDSTPPEKRASVLKDFESGKIRLVSQCMILTEGYDNPAVELIVMSRPTKSRSLYAQQVGRSTRPLPGIVDGLETADERRNAIKSSAKPYCVAEGTLILTDSGLVPIENITPKNKVWDGVEFVTNDGIVFRGKRKVITYAGLTATPDHKVWTSKGWQTLGQCSAQQTPIAVTGIGREAVRETDSHYRGYCSSVTAEKNPIPANRVRLRGTLLQGIHEPDKRERWMPEMWPTETGSHMALSTMPERTREMPKFQTQILPFIRGQRYQIPIFRSDGNGFVDQRESGFTSGVISGQKRKQWQLRTRKSSIPDAKTKHLQHAQAAYFRRDSCFPVGASRSEIQRCPPQQTLSSGFDMEGCLGVGKAAQTRSEASIQRQKTVRVYDILNAGPRHRFTANGLLVSNCVVLDFVGNSGRHKLVTSAELLGGNVSDRAIERAKKLAQMDGKPVNMRKALNQAQAEIDREDEEAKKQEEARRRSKLVAKVDYRVKFVNPFDILDLHPIKPRGWDTGKTLTEKQRNLLRKQGCDPDSMSYTEGHQLLQEMFRRWRGELATLGQCKVLKRYGMPTDISRKEASNLIDQLAKNNWRPLPLRLETK